jgi:hypothetical protein
MDGAVQENRCQGSRQSRRVCDARTVTAPPSALPSRAHLSELRGKDWAYEPVNRSPGKALRLQQPIGTLITSEA